MSEKSPLFISSMELLSHAVELLEQDDGRKNKFVVLHLSNAVELLLKDMVIDCSESIYEANSKTTINIWTALKIVEKYGASLSKRPHIEMLIDDRNAIQHKFGHPTKECVVYYLDIVIETFRECLKNRYDVEFNDVAKEYFSESGLLLVGVSQKSEFETVKAIAKYDLLSGVATAYSLLEAKVHQLLTYSLNSRPIMIWHDPRFYMLLKAIDRSLIDEQNPKAYFDEIRRLRNLAVHRQHHDVSTEGDAMSNGIEKIEKLIMALDAIPELQLEIIRANTAVNP
ncbi:MAG: hypothetical protein WC426_09400 [Sulfuriferula sp.]